MVYIFPVREIFHPLFTKVIKSISILLIQYIKVICICFVSMSDEELDRLAPWNEDVKAEIERRSNNSNQ